MEKREGNGKDNKLQQGKMDNPICWIPKKKACSTCMKI